MNAEDRIERARTLYEQAVYSGDASVLANAERDLDAVEADAALARGRILHARFLNERASSGSSPAEDPAELPLFERATELYQALGDTRGQAETLFWIGCLHQVIRRDNETALPHLERSRQMAAQVGDNATQAEALRHLGIVAHMAGRLDEARERLEESSRLRREVGALPGVAANMVGLAYIAAAQDRHPDAFAILDEANAIAQAHGAHAIVRQIEQARTQL
ncbi:tetratricopeptide repeat protein [Micromonospora sp. NPDC048935]|uniref:tetratricopeptide repeat protein n=1 Tax=Micromonospora sp. NPDC048935 TaxID=3364262 RepID=UPI003716B092